MPLPSEAPITLREMVMLTNKKNEEMFMDLVFEGKSGNHFISLVPVGVEPNMRIAIQGSRARVMKIFEDAKEMKGKTYNEIDEFLQKSSRESKV